MRTIIDKIKYIEFCTSHDFVPIFNSSQWLDSVSDNWSAVVIINENNVVIAGFPFHMKNRFFFKAISMPLLTPYFRILIAKGYENEEEKLTSLIINSLPSSHYQSIILDPIHENYLPWKWMNYNITTRYTFQLSAIDNYNIKLKNHIRYSSKNSMIVDHNNIEEHYSLVCQTFNSQNIEPPMSLALLTKIYTENKNQIKLIKCIDESNATQASLLCLFDEKYCYNISSGRHQNALRGAVSSLTDFTIQWSISNNKIFDFEGSSIEPIYKFYEQFGGKLTRPTRVTKANNKIVKLMTGITNRI